MESQKELVGHFASLQVDWTLCNRFIEFFCKLSLLAYELFERFWLLCVRWEFEVKTIAFRVIFNWWNYRGLILRNDDFLGIETRRPTLLLQSFSHVGFKVGLLLLLLSFNLLDFSGCELRHRFVVPPHGSEGTNPVVGLLRLLSPDGVYVNPLADAVVPVGADLHELALLNLIPVLVTDAFDTPVDELGARQRRLAVGIERDSCADIVVLAVSDGHQSLGTLDAECQPLVCFRLHYLRVQYGDHSSRFYLLNGGCCLLEGHDGEQFVPVVTVGFQSLLVALSVTFVLLLKGLLDGVHLVLFNITDLDDGELFTRLGSDHSCAVNYHSDGKEGFQKLRLF